MSSLPPDNLSYPIFIELGSSSGSGFYFRSKTKMYIVTARHVLFNVNEKDCPLYGKQLNVTSYDKNISLTDPLEHQGDLSKLNIIKDDSKDIALIEIGKIETDSYFSFCKGYVQVSKRPGKLVVVPEESLRTFKDVTVSNDVFILGYPVSLAMFSQFEKKRPLLRKGIVAGKNEPAQTIVLDCPVYPGNSGGIVIEVNPNDKDREFLIIGVVSQFVPMVKKVPKAESAADIVELENSGYSIIAPADVILNLTKL